MMETEGGSPLGERVTRLEAMFEATLLNRARRERDDVERQRIQFAEQRRRDRCAADERRELAACLSAVIARLDKFEPAILGDKDIGQKSLSERLEAVEHMILSARAGWKAAALIGTTFVALASAVTYAIRLAPTLIGFGSSGRR